MDSTYAIVRFGNKQHKVRNGETLVVERVRTDEGKSFQPDVLLGEAKVTATVIAHERGPKIRIGKYPSEVAAPKTVHPPKGYEEMTIAEIKEGVEKWRRPQVEAALEFEHAHAARKGAIAALEAAIAAKEEK